MLYPVELSAHSVLSPCFLIVFHSPRNYKSFSEKSIVKTMKKNSTCEIHASTIK